MPNGQPIGRAGKNLYARGQNWAGLSHGKNFRAGLGGPKDITITIWAGWAAHFLMGFSCARNMRGLQLLIQIYNRAYFYLHINEKLFALTCLILNVSFGILLLHQDTHLATQYLFFGIECSVVYCVTFHKAFAIPRAIRKFKGKVASVAKTNNAIDIFKKGESLTWVRSVPPVAIKVGSFHTFERMSTPNFLAFGIKNIVRVLIACRNR